MSLYRECPPFPLHPDTVREDRTLELNYAMRASIEWSAGARRRSERAHIHVVKTRDVLQA